MRILFALPLLLLGACEVTTDDTNDSVSIEYDQNTAEEAVADIANGAEQAGEAIANGAEDAVDTAQNVDVDVDTNTADNSN